jgi:hypothetical protein
VTANDSGFGLETKILVAGETLFTFPTTTGIPTKADAVTDLYPPGMFTDSDHLTDHLVAGDEGISGHAPIIVEHGEVTMADTATFHGDLHLLAAEGSGSVLERLQRLLGT